MKPLLIVVSGNSATGKTTMARKLAQELGIPLFVRDEIKEQLFDSLGWKDREWSKNVGSASFDILYHISSRLLDAGVTHIIEANFTKQLSEQNVQTLIREHPCDVVQIYLKSGDSVRHERFETRWRSKNRHPGHVEDSIIEKHQKDSATGVESEWFPLDLPGEYIEVDTTDFAAVDFAAVQEKVRNLLR